METIYLMYVIYLTRFHILTYSVQSDHVRAPAKTRRQPARSKVFWFVLTSALAKYEFTPEDINGHPKTKN